MLQDRYEIDKFFENILILTNQMDPVLSQIDLLLEDEALYQLIRNDLANRFRRTEQTGRNSTPVEVVLRLLAVKRLYGLSYEQVEYQVRDSLVLRKFCRVYFNSVPDDTTLLRWAALIQPETMERFNQRLTALATQLKVTQGRKLRTDGTVIETNIHPPSDSSLLADSASLAGPAGKDDPGNPETGANAGDLYPQSRAGSEPNGAPRFQPGKSAGCGKDREHF